MNWLALRLLRPYLIVAATLSAISTGVVLVGAYAIQHQLTAHGIVVEDYAPDRTGLCVKLVSCLPTGTATNLAQLVALLAVFVPLLVGLILGVPLFAREREESTDAFILTQSVPRSRWLFTKLAWALAAGATCTVAIAVAFRLAAARYALMVDDPAYELLREVHKNNISLMVMQTVFITALAGVLGLAVGRTLRTLVVAVVVWPVALIVAQIGGLLLGLLFSLLTSWSASLSMKFGTLTEDETATFAALALGAGTIVAVLIGRRIVAPPPTAPTPTPAVRPLPGWGSGDVA
jgi:ABC-type transport system involved in multi-copper enzyme maturation permease subunit